MKIAVCDDDKLLTGEIDGQLQRIQQKMGISFETDIFFDGETLWEAIEKHGSYDIIYLDIGKYGWNNRGKKDSGTGSVYHSFVCIKL